MTTKTCHACKVTKPTTEFFKSKNSKDGLAPSCKSCQMGRTPTVVQKTDVEIPKRQKEIHIFIEHNSPTGIYIVPTEKEYKKRRADKRKSWDDVYGRKCVPCRRKFQPGERYQYCPHGHGFRHVDCKEVI